MDKRPHKIPRGKPVEVVLGGGGVKGFSHVGFLKAIEELGIRRGTVTGVSIGSLAAALYANGYSPAEIEEIFLKELFSLNSSELARAMVTPAILSRFLGKPMDVGEIIVQMVERYKLEPKDDLRIVAYNVLARKPVVFEGTGYDLGTALSASCAVPMVMRPVWYGVGQSNLLGDALTLAKSALGQTTEGVLVDGGVHHPAPAEFCKGKAIIARLGFASRLPRFMMSPIDIGFHMMEFAASGLLDWFFPDPKDHIVVPVGCPDVACLTFGTPEGELKRMVDYGYEQTLAHLK